MDEPEIEMSPTQVPKRAISKLAAINSKSCSGRFTDLWTVITLGCVTNYLDTGGATNATGSYYRVRWVP